MTDQIAIIIGAFVIAASIIAAKFIAPYQMAAGTDANGPFAWRMNAISGNIEYCSGVNVIRAHHPQSNVGEPIQQCE